MVMCPGVMAQDLFDYPHSRKFANELYNAQNYELAAFEFERLLSMNINDDTTKYLLLKSYRLSGNLKAGIARSHQVYENTLIMPENVANEYLLLLLLNSDFDDLNRFLNSNINIPSLKKTEISMYSCLLTKNWQDARIHYLGLQKQGNVSSGLEDIFYELDKLKYKKPYLAASMSSVVPGSGKIYAGYWKDGLYTLGILGVTSWQAYRGFETDGQDSVYGWIFTGLSGIIYLSNIYGSQKAARSRNLANETSILTKVRNLISVQ